MLPTIRDVARQAGVSIATVSRVMRESEGVRDATRIRVLAAAEELEYTPSQLGRQLAERRHAANGIVFPDLSGPYYAEVVLGYEAVAAELRRSVLILSTHGRSDAESAVREMAGRCDGLVILVRTVSDAVVQQLAARGTRLVLVARPPIGSVDSVNAENHASAVIAHRAPALRGRSRSCASSATPMRPPTSPSGGPAPRTRSGAPATRPHARAGSRRTSSTRSPARPWPPPPSRPTTCPTPSSAPTTSSRSACSAASRSAGVDVPGTVMVTGWDDVMAARYAGLTTVRQPMRELGATAARLLDELIVDGRTEPRHELLPTELVIRSSSSSTSTKEPK